MTGQHPHWLRARIADFVRDERGNVSIETVIVIPLLLFLTTAGLTYWNAFNSNSRTAKVAYTIADIMSRHDAVDNLDMQYLFNLGNKMLPGSVFDRTLRITSICMQDGLYRVMWSYSAANDTNILLPPLAEADIPFALMPTMKPQDSVLLVELSGSWSPQFMEVGLGTSRWNNQLVVRPRFANKFIPHATLNPSNICPSAGTT